MVDEFIHATVGASLSQAEWEALLAHVANNQARGDVLISNAAATGWKRLAKGAQGKILLMGADDPAWGGAQEAALDYGLSFQAIVTTYTDTTHFKASGLTGKGNNYFKGYFAYVVWDAGGAGAAPQGEAVAISDYVSSDGTFTHAAFTIPLAATDEVLIIHPYLWYLLELKSTNIPADVDTIKAKTNLIGASVALVPVVEQIIYTPILQDTTDLEATTKAITVTAEAAGVGNADYSAALTLPAPSDARLAVLRIAARLAVTIDSMTAGTLRGRVYVDSQVAGNLLFDATWTTTGAKLDAVDTHADDKAIIFNLLKNGAAHTFYFFFWVNAGNAVLSLCQLWEAVGTSSASAGGTQYPFLVAHKGLISMSCFQQIVGTGTPSSRYSYVGAANAYFIDGPTGYSQDGGNTAARVNSILCDDAGNGRLQLVMWGTVATDINYCGQVALLMKSG